MPEEEQTTLTFRLPPDLAKRLERATTGALAPSKSQIAVQGLRLALAEVEKARGK